MVQASKIKVGHIYNVMFDPVRNCEFNGKHLAVVLKKNNDKSTFIVMPLTSASNGNGINKFHVGKIASLPTSLRNNDTYAVFNQVRTVNASRFVSLKEGAVVIDAPFPKDEFRQLLAFAVKELAYSIDQDDKISLLKTVYEQECVEKAKDIAYRIISLEKTSDNVTETILELESQIKSILSNASYSLEQKHINNGVKEIFERSLKS